MPRFAFSLLATSVVSSFTTMPVFSHGLDFERIEVVGRQTRLNGEALSASAGLVGQQEIAAVPLLRVGEVLELVPGMVVTQHSGSGKANQYFLRGFNLDHGTDFAVSVNGMPVNMRTHGHGQGYTDINFVIPEFIKHIEYSKGAYSALDGDFSTAGSAQFYLANTPQNNLAKLEVGEDNYRRVVAGNTLEQGNHSIFFGGELHQYDGPWQDINEDINKRNGVINYQQQTEQGGLMVTLMAYDNSWNAADQIPSRAVSQGLITRLGSLDPSLGGESERYSLSANFTHNDFHANVYGISSSLNLFSNFTYFLNDPENGDQFQQVDDRNIYGGDVGYHFSASPTDMDWVHQLGLQFRIDDIDEVGLHNSAQRQRLSTVRTDAVEQQSTALYYQGDLLLTSRLTLRLGARYDMMDVQVESDNPLNSGDADDDLFSVSGGISYIFSPRWEGYLNAGQSFHSNDARGATITLDPQTGDAAQPVDLLVRGNTAEVGVRYFDSKSLNFSASLWWLELDSELLFVGDAGNTEAGRASKRYGAEIAAYYWFNDQLSADVELALTHSRFKGQAPGEGNHIDGALSDVLSTGLSWHFAPNWQLSARLRHFGPRALDSYKQQESDGLTVLNAKVAYEYQSWQFTLQALNLLDSEDHDIDYLYESQLANETNPVEDVHYHPIEPRTWRASVSYRF